MFFLIQGEAGRAGNSGEVGFPGSAVTLETMEFILLKSSIPINNLAFRSYLGTKRISWNARSARPEGASSE